MNKSATAQLELDLTPFLVPARKTAGDPYKRGEAAFREFHEANPQVYRNLRALAFAVLNSGQTKFGMRLLWERLRWELIIHTAHREGDYRLNDHYVPYYARLLMAREPALRGVFETRALRGGAERIAENWRRGKA